MSSTHHPNFGREIGRVGGYAKDTLSGFRAFILRGNVVDLAIGIVIGAAFTSVVNALVSDIITPLVPVAKGLSLSSLQWILYNNPKSVLNMGGFINAVISFLVVAAVLYFFIVRPVNAFMDRYKPQKVEVTMRDCPYCLQSIPLRATRCAYCTSPLPAPGEISVTRQPGEGL